MLMGEAAFKARCQDIKSAISAKEFNLERRTHCLSLVNAEADEMEDEEAIMKRKEVGSYREYEIEEAKKMITAFKTLLTDVTRDWTEEKNRVIGHVTLSPPITFNYGTYGFTDDWAVVQIEPSMISRLKQLNFIGNVINLGRSIDVGNLTIWMYPNRANRTSFEYPIDSLLRFTGTISDQEMFSPKIKDPVTMVLMNGSTSGLCVGRLNTIRAFVRQYFNGLPGERCQR
jgi:hypothetical protein